MVSTMETELMFPPDHWTTGARRKRLWMLELTDIYPKLFSLRPQTNGHLSHVEHGYNITGIKPIYKTVESAGKSTVD